MISDVLSDAAHEIKDYEQRMPDCYSGLTHELEKVRTVMDAMRTYLDLPPGGGKLRDDLLKAIGRLDVRRVQKAIGAIYTRAEQERGRRAEQA